MLYLCIIHESVGGQGTVCVLLTAGKSSLSLSAATPNSSSLNLLYTYKVCVATPTKRWPAKLNFIWIHLKSLLWTTSWLAKVQTWQTEGRPSDPKASSVSTHTCLIPNTAPESPTRTLYWPVSEKLNLRVWVLKRLKGSFEKQSKVSGERLPATSSSAFMIHGKKTGDYNNTQTLRTTCILKCCLKVH